MIRLRAGTELAFAQTKKSRQTDTLDVALKSELRPEPRKRLPTLHVVPATDALMILSRFVALVALIIASPILLLIALVVRVTSSGPALYKQTRVGRYNRHFEIVKFRTMCLDAEAKTGPVLARASDPRVTFVGKILRATHLDELPQLWNVVRGDMCFIGPRPERPEFVTEFEARIENYGKRHLVYPGITGMAQILLPYDAKPENKLTFDLTYGDARRDLNLDLWIIKETIMKMIRALVPIGYFAQRVNVYPRLVTTLLVQMRAERQLQDRLATR